MNPKPPPHQSRPYSLQEKALALLKWAKTIRYLKFGLVGASGTLVNIVVLTVCHQTLFSEWEKGSGKPYFSLAVAIAVATLNNFTWNRLWTWADRAHGATPSATPLAKQLGQYTLASWFGIALQYGLTIWLSQFMHYIAANLIAIVIASVSNFLANDRWTFKQD